MRQPALNAFATLAVVATASLSSTARADDAPIASDPAAPQAPAPYPPYQPGQPYPPAPGTWGAARPPPPPPASPSASCSVNQCASNCACATRCCSRACNCDGAPKVKLSVTGVRAAVTRVSAGPVKESTLGVGFAGSADTYALDGTTHGSGYFMLGGGEGGFEGALAGTIDIGYWHAIDDVHGPFGRIGFDGRLQGNDVLYFSMLELPRLTLGYQYLKNKTVIEGGARGGAVLVGLYDPAEAGRRALNGFEWGGFIAMQLDFLRIDASAMRIEAKNTLNGTPVDVGRGQLCIMGGKVGGCFDAMLFRGDAEMRAENSAIRSTTAQYIGLTLGLSGW